MSAGLPAAALLAALAVFAVADPSTPNAAPVSFAGPAVRTVATTTQGQTGPDSAQVSAFFVALAASDPLVCAMAVDQLGNGWGWHGARSGVGSFRDVPATTRAALDALNQSVEDQRAVPFLAANLGSANSCLRRAAGVMLGASDLPAAVQALRTAYSSPEARVREAAAFGLGTREDSTSMEALIRGLKDAVFIAEQLKRASVEIDHRWVNLDAPVKALGKYEVPVRLAAGVVASLKFWVVGKDK